MTKERGIIFNGWSVRRILAGAKTQTRRVIKKPERLNGLMLEGEAPDWCPYGRPGDRLYVREKWSGEYWLREVKPAERWEKCPVWYWADGDPHYGDWEKPRPSIHMPKAFARIWLEITDVRDERVQDISEADARAEGVDYGIVDAVPPDEDGSLYLSAHESFALLWDEINANRGYGWNANPWVWVVEFDVVEAPND